MQQFTNDCGRWTRSAIFGHLSVQWQQSAVDSVQQSALPPCHTSSFGHRISEQHQPQWRVRDSIINISKQDLIVELNAVKRQCELPETNSKELRWLHDMERQRRAKEELNAGAALDAPVFIDKQVTKLRQFPSYGQVLTPRAHAKIKVIYKVEFDAYADCL